MSIEAVLPESKPNTKTDIPFKPGSWLTKIDFINHLVLFNNKLISVVAEQGGGKTTFVSLLKSSLDSAIRSHIICAVAPFSSSSFLSQLSEAFHLRKEAEITASSIVEQINERKAHVLLIIDDAQHLPDSFIQQILPEITKQGSSGYFHLCLVSDYTMTASLNSMDKEFFASSVHSIELGSLTESETKTYLLRNLPSPKRLDKTMTDKRLAQFYDMTGGKIAQINCQMIEFFDADTLVPAKKSKGNLFKLVNRTAIAAIVLGGGYGIWQHQDLLLAKYQRTTSNKPAKMDKVAELTIIPKVQQVVELKQNDAVLASYIVEWTLGSVNHVAQYAPKRTNLFEFDSLDDDEDTDEDLAKLVEMDKVVVIPKPASKPIAVASIAAVAKNPVKPVNLQLKSSLVSIAEVPKPATIAQSDMPVISTSGKANYTIQLLASSNKEDLNRYIKNHPTIKQATIRKVERKGSAWYVLTYGQFGQREDARVAMNKLTEFKPWIRPLAGLTSVG